MRVPNLNSILNKRSKHNKIIKQFSAFLISGCTSNIISFFVYLIFYQQLSLSSGIASFCGQIIALIVSYIMNSRLSFKKKANSIGKSLYSGYYFSAIIIVSIAIEMLTQRGFEYRIAWLFCVITASICNFIFMKYFIFKN